MNDSNAPRFTCICSLACPAVVRKAYIDSQPPLCYIVNQCKPCCFLHPFRTLMPHCLVCGAYFQGRGSQCALHNSHRHRSIRRQDLYNYSSDSTDPSSIRYRTTQQHHRPRTLRFADTCNTYGGSNNHANTLVPYDYDGTSINPNTALAQPLVHTFTTLSHAHAISSLTYSILPSGGQSLTAEANFDREQCPVCRTWFPDHQKLEYHQWDLPVGCEVHGMCMRMEDVVWHGTSEKHDRCFVRGCGSVYRKEGRWKGGVVEAHVKSWHC